ncbi:envelope glycoprotein M [Testudinid alphaherpesvirus 3]|uniref:Glycoprotein M n=1 Tax=Testudinid alphaherpesvirus 3 TaxID=2560801 RepID=A0A0K1R1V8_9ALPH|nr:envelope glycoprotein M [Testudinid alphaherpesvirus 3]AIU39284.1 envelope glycoprotein M [Testudinid alphaherpesvirus 3]AIU39394.1 envelope glycoprotein M [Testudinid alphaherpesvirus 3]AKI81670.1 envelope glycoprotein M [Testudinid alphaherpesvirus 3]AKI81773.1 envelope glycoprotein M [Testudinid alphaherpesvirus 3]AKV40681.1 glycoprotein M [Testudinid alphaherpesvirus 3]
MGMSNVNRMTWRLWSLQSSASLLSLVILSVLAIAAAFDGLGYPCYYAILVDYTTLNVSNYGSWEPAITPVLFLERLEMAFYVYATVVLLMAFGIYLLIGVILVGRLDVIDIKKFTRLVASNHLVFVLGFMFWAFGVFINLLAFKTIVLAAAFHTIYYGLLILFVIYSTTRGVSPNMYHTSNAMVKQPHKQLYNLVVYGKGVVINCLHICFALSTLMQCLLIELVIGNNFRLKIADVISIGIGLFCTLVVIFMLVSEIVLVRYVSGTIGIPLGAILASILIGIPTLRYETKFSYIINGETKRLNQLVSGLLGAVAVLAVILVIVRFIRLVITNRRDNTSVYRKSKQLKAKMERLQRKKAPLPSLPTNDNIPLLEVGENEEDIYDVIDSDRESTDEESVIYENVNPTYVTFLRP